VKPTIGEVGADLPQSMTGSGLSRDGKEGSAHHFLALRPRASLLRCRLPACFHAGVTIVTALSPNHR
jgi:hypothetical protein